MIYSRIRGGLGNQMFQYSAARSLADHLGVDLGLDVREYNSSSNFKMGLSNFNIRANLNPHGLIKHKQDGKFSYIIENLFGKHSHVYHEPFLSFDTNYIMKPNGTYFKGYWQSEKYFKENKNIRNDFKIVKPTNQKNLHTKIKIQSCNSISLHIRRGDYVSNKTHGTCDLTYYHNAVQYFMGLYGNNFEIFAFSDDVNWVKSNLKLPVKIHFINHNLSKYNYEDMNLMSLCNHNIIANSSFSWWGAWLNYNPQKIVIVPKNWFANKKVENNDITPENWLRM